MQAIEFIVKEMPYILSGEVEKTQRDTQDGSVMIYKCGTVIRIDIKPRKVVIGKGNQRF